MIATGQRRLILTRHAKSSWAEPGLADIDRPLNTRGKHAASELGHWLATRGYLPDEVLCSPARRTRETWQGAAPALTDAPEPQMIARLYHASPETMLAALRTARGTCVMMLGHNPGIAAFAASLPTRPPLDPDFLRYPTAATLVVDFEIADWTTLAPGLGSTRDFFRPARGA